MASGRVEIQIGLQEQRYWAVVSGKFAFDSVGGEVESMRLAVPPDACKIRVWVDEAEVEWDWSEQQHATGLVEWPTVPMIEWAGPFAQEGTSIRVEYEHELIERADEIVLFYALGTGRHLQTAGSMTAEFIIAVPTGLKVKGVWVGEEEQAYTISGRTLRIIVQSENSPIAGDLVVSFETSYFESCGVLVQGVECVLFNADAEGVYVIANRGDFRVGDRVRVRGILEKDCISFCMQGQGCIVHNTIEPCPECDFNRDGAVNLLDLVIMGTWWQQGCDENNGWCEGADLNKDGRMDFRDLVDFSRRWLAETNGYVVEETALE